MKTGFGVVFAVVVTLGLSWLGFVVGPAMQLGAAKQTTVLISGDAWPQQRTGEATLGQQVYRANGCVACHTMQIRQDGIICDVILAKPGKNPTAVTNLMATLKLTGLSKEEADDVSQKISDVGGSAQTLISATGPDIKNGWGVRRSVAADFLYDTPVQLGNLRVGPDLANVGARSTANLLMVRLYAPRSVNQNSTMPSYKFLFDLQKIGDAPSPDALKDLPRELTPAEGFEIVPKPEAKQLVAYLLSLHADVPLYEAPFTPAAKH